MSKCKKTPYARKEAKKQVFLRNKERGRDEGTGGVYWCREHKGWRISRSKFPIIHPKVWDSIHKKGFTKR